MRRWWGPAPLLEQSVQTNIFSLPSAVTEGTRLSSFGDLCKRIRACKGNIVAWIRMAIAVLMSGQVATGVFFPARLALEFTSSTSPVIHSLPASYGGEKREEEDSGDTLDLS